MTETGSRGSEAVSDGPESRAFVLLGAVLIVVMAAVLASVSTPAPHTGGDNAGYLALAHALAEGSGYVELWDPAVPAHTKYPPMFALTLAALVLAGASTWGAFKLLVAGWLSLAVVCVFTWAATRRGAVVGVAVAALTLLSSGWLEASRWILSEPLFLAFTFFALWAAERGMRDADWSAVLRSRPRSVSGSRSDGSGAADGGPKGREGESAPFGGWVWLLLAALAAAAAFFTRSAGLPLVLALFVALLLARRLRAALLFVGGLAPLVSWWVLRARYGGEGAYQAEFWMVNPYEPELGTIGWLDLPGRIWNNLVLYVGEVLPGEWWGSVGTGALAALGIGLTGLALGGWWLRVRKGPRVAELFVPLYLGLILLWPEVWSGDRFLLPLHPFILLYSGAAVAGMLRPLGRASVTGALAVGFLALALPALPGWMSKAESASACRRVAQSEDVFRCHGAGFQEFRDAAAWSGANLPEDAVVLNRKPRIHYLLGGARGRVFPFTRDPAVLLDEADRVGARYLLLDHVDGISPYYLPAVIRARPLAFCHLVGWGGGERTPGTDLFGILPVELRRPGTNLADLGPCPESYLASDRREVEREGVRVPRFVGRPDGG